MHSARVLVVEDEALVAAALDSCLRNLGHQVAASTARGEDAVRKAVALDPDLILMDIRLQGALDGIEAAHRINQCLKIPIVYLTAHSDEQTLLRARVTEPYGFVLKPFDEQSLKSVIEITLYRAAVQAQVRRSRARLLAVLDGIGEAVLVTDLKGEISFCNEAAARLLGGGYREVLGCMLSEVFQFLDETGTPAVLPVNEVILEGKTVSLKNVGLRRRDEDHRAIDLELAPFRNDAGNLSGVILAFHESLL